MLVSDNEIKNINNIESIEHFEFIISLKGAERLKKVFKKRFEDFSYSIEFSGFNEAVKNNNFYQFILEKSEYRFVITVYENNGFYYELEIDEILFDEIIEYFKTHF